MKGRPVHERLGFALAGIKTSFLREHSFRAHVVMASIALVALLIVRPAPIWWAIFAIVAGLVFAFELVNSALEAVIDLLHPELHPEIKAAKDMASGAVLVIGFAAVAVAIAMFWEWFN